jgi:hypothetical protein
LLIPLVLAGEGDPLGVGRELRKEFEARVRGQARGGAATGSDGPDVARVAERDAMSGKRRSLVCAVALAGRKTATVAATSAALNRMDMFLLASVPILHEPAVSDLLDLVHPLSFHLFCLVESLEPRGSFGRS